MLKRDTFISTYPPVFSFSWENLEKTEERENTGWAAYCSWDLLIVTVTAVMYLQCNHGVGRLGWGAYEGDDVLFL